MMTTTIHRILITLETQNCEMIFKSCIKLKNSIKTKVINDHTYAFFCATF
jgi:hypothetical protein